MEIHVLLRKQQPLDSESKITGACRFHGILHFVRPNNRQLLSVSAKTCRQHAPQKATESTIVTTTIQNLHGYYMGPTRNTQSSVQILYIM